MSESNSPNEHFLEVETVEGASVLVDSIEVQSHPIFERLLRFRIEDLTTRWKYRLTIVDPLAKPDSMWLKPRYVIVSQAAFDVVETTKLLHDGEHVADVVMTRAGYPVECIGKIERMPDLDWEEVSL
jgi:hypothetical protein